MSSFSLKIKGSAVKELNKLPSFIFKPLDFKIRSLTTDPYPFQSKKLQSSESMYRVRVGNYRIIYSVDKKNKMILIEAVKHRKDSYRGI